MPGGVGKGGAVCTKKEHDPTQGGEPKKWCSCDHSHWGIPEPKQADLDKARAEVKLNLAAARAARGVGASRGRGVVKKKK